MNWTKDEAQASNETIRLNPLVDSDADEFLQLYQANRVFLGPWVPTVDDEFFTLAGQTSNLLRMMALRETDQAYGYGIRLVENNQLVGRITLSNVVRGAWESATLGYWVSQTSNRRGIATSAVALVLDLAFDVLELHRVQAAVMPYNAGSLRVIEKTGFLYEGYAPYYLRIAGRWQDHNIYSMTREMRQGPHDNSAR